MNSLAAKNAKSAKVWPMVRLGDVCEINLGKTPPRGNRNCWDMDKLSGFVWVSIADMATLVDGKVLDSKEYITKYAIEEFGVPVVEKGTLLLSFKLTLGRVAIAGQNLYTNEAIAALPIKKEYVSKVYLPYLKLYFSFFDWLGFAERDEKVLGKTLNKKKLAEVPLLIPPLSVQKEIVERLETELGEADKVAANFRKIAEMADAEFKAELYETFGELERREFLTQRRKGAESAESACPMVRLGDVCEEIRERISVDEVPLKNYITTDNMLKGCGGVRVAESVPFEGSLVKYQIGDVLISNIRPYLKKAWLADRDGGCSSDVIVFRSRRIDLSNEYLYKALSQDGFFEYSMLNVSGTKMPRGKREWIKEFQIPLPSIEVQKGIFAKLDAAKERCEKLKAEAERGLKAAENLRKAILSEAFE